MAKNDMMRSMMSSPFCTSPPSSIIHHSPLPISWIIEPVSTVYHYVTWIVFVVWTFTTCNDLTCRSSTFSVEAL